MTQITLSVSDRLILKNLLPERGTIDEMEIIEGLFNKINFTAEEVERFQLVNIPNDVITFNLSTAEDITINVDAAALAVLKDIPVKIDQVQQVTVVMIPLLKKLRELV